MAPQILPRDKHIISRKNIDADALKVLYRLSRSGHTAYLVGGGVRDLLLSRSPKDFDVSTSARPQEVRKLFRNCRLIGRRFRLAHIIYGRGKVIEVSTFRRATDESEAEGEGDLLVRRDNTYGSPEEDARRRDFTINGLFYDISSFSVIDHVGGLDDLQHRVIRTIGEPDIRFREDPIRMLRAIKFAARLDFRISEQDLGALHRHRGDLLKVAPERLNLELSRLLAGGAAHTAFKLLRATGLMEVVLPELSAYLAQLGEQADGPDCPLWRQLRGLDELSGELAAGDGEELPQSVLFGALLGPMVELAVRGHDFSPTAESLPERPGVRYGIGFSRSIAHLTEPSEDETEPSRDAVVARLLLPLVQRLAIPRKEADRLLALLGLMPRVRQPPGRAAAMRSLARRQPALAEALLLYAIELAGQGRELEPYHAWLRLLPELEDWRATRQPRRRSRRPPPARAAQAAAQPAQEEPARKRRPRRRRRRRRRPGQPAAGD